VTIRRGPRGGTKQHYTHLKRIDPSKKSVDRQLQQVPTELQQEYNYYHSINLEKEKEEMGPRMFGMFKMNREGAYVPSLSAMYASALEVEREEERRRRRWQPIGGQGVQRAGGGRSRGLSRAGERRQRPLPATHAANAHPRALGRRLSLDRRPRRRGDERRVSRWMIC
jgi:hypothetical protein